MAEDVKKRVSSLFPRMDEVPAEADFAPGGGLYDKGTLYLVDGEVRRWTGKVSRALSAVCVSRGGTAAPREIGAAARLDKEAALEALKAAVRAWDHGRGKWPTMRVGERV